MTEIFDKHMERLFKTYSKYKQIILEMKKLVSTDFFLKSNKMYACNTELYQIQFAETNVRKKKEEVQIFYNN